MEQFEAAAAKIKVVDASKTSNEDKLKLYALFKQVNGGDCNTTRPGMLDLAGKAKWDAWKALEGKSKDDAMKEYVIEVDRQLASIA
eukprot:jgi/Undpi1/5205/HiC_scaffold_2.g00487.m1